MLNHDHRIFIVPQLLSVSTRDIYFMSCCYVSLVVYVHITNLHCTVESPITTITFCFCGTIAQVDIILLPLFTYNIFR